MRCRCSTAARATRRSAADAARDARLELRPARPREQDAFTALGAFAGGCDLDAAEAVTGAPLEVLEQLVAKSLVIVTDGRLALLEPVRQYAAERLAARSDAHAVRLRHLDHYVALAERTETAVWALERGCPEFAALQRDHDNLRAAVGAGLRSGETRRVLRLVSALSSYMSFAEAADELRSWWGPAYAASGRRPPGPQTAPARASRSRRPSTASRRGSSTSARRWRSSGRSPTT